MPEETFEFDNDFQQALWAKILGHKIAEDEIIWYYLTDKINFQFLTANKSDYTNGQLQWLVNHITTILLSKKLEEIISILKSRPETYIISPQNVPQFSSFATAVMYLPQLLCETHDKFTYSELGYRLYVYCDNDMAAQKYGENHGKVAYSLDLAFRERNGRQYLFSSSILTPFFYELSLDDKMKLIARLCYRYPMVRKAINYSDPQSALINFLGQSLSPTVFSRRKANCLEILNFAMDR